ncbi:protein of unknown function [Candidatus Hydrogenisulfobacillus filiaventi]|uniref:Uncharacterized protein n=1 Tax=Candidatus Hydrogenisulfobacillus filiaventi TaxID=2707344 RepID=A0A6F8ZIE4_9FIRM|nr:protein of unknown function [Candidatus Hydrogenisulfobacillus filiaventi]
MTFAGWGQPPDPPVVPIVLRLWRMGIATDGSCAGHRGSPTYITVRPGATEVGEAHWHTLAVIGLRAQWPRGCSVAWSASGVEARYSPLAAEDPAFAHRVRTSLLRQMRRLLDAMGHVWDASGLSWTPWEPVPVPDGVEPATLGTEAWFAFWRARSESERLVAELRWVGQSWSAIALETGLAADACRRMWTDLWSGWRAIAAHGNLGRRPWRSDGPDPVGPSGSGDRG